MHFKIIVLPAPAPVARPPCGQLRAKHIGEVHAGQASGNELEASLDKLLAESASCGPARP